MSRDLRPIYTAVNSAAAEEALSFLEWGCPLWGRSGARPTGPSRGCGATAGRSSSRSWTIRDVEIRRVLCSTDAIESLNARYRRAANAKGHFPTEQAALKTLYLVTRSLDPKGTGQAR